MRSKHVELGGECRYGQGQTRDRDICRHYIYPAIRALQERLKAVHLKEKVIGATHHSKAVTVKAR